MNKDSALLRLHVDAPLLVGTLLISILGLVVLYSASDQSLDTVLKQSSRLLVGFIAMFLVAQISPSRIAEWSFLLYLLGIMLLVIVLFFGSGRSVKRWLDIGFVSFQPSEIMKLVVPLTVASIVSKRNLPPNGRTILISFVIIIVPAVLIMRQPDLGTSILMTISGLLVLFFSGVSWNFMRNSFVVGVAIAPLGWFAMHDYQRQRILTLFNPDNDALGAGYHIIQSKIAVGSGGLFGKGWLNGTQSHLEFIPEKATDFIFAVYCEEFGLVGVFILMLGYGLVIVRGVQISIAAQDAFGRLISVVLTLIFFVYIFVNIGMVTGQLPVVGIPLPFISFGGTSLVTLLLGMGILMSVHTHRKINF